MHGLLWHVSMIYMTERENLNNEVESEDLSSPFAERFGDALGKVLDDEENRELWERFRYAFEYRAEFPWLGEAQGSDVPDDAEGAIAYALRTALSTYSASPPERMPGEARTELDPGFLDDLGAAAEFVANDEFTVYAFAHSLWHAGLQPEELSVEDVSREIQRAVHTYWDRSESGLSPDPW
jgi:hypothetical protein